MSVVFEQLEGRTLMSSATLQDGVLRVRGDDTRNTILLRINPGRTQILVEIDGEEALRFSREQVQRITVNGKAGDDTLNIDEINGRVSNVKIGLYGGDDNDLIRGGRDKIEVFGQDGHDQLLGIRGYADGGAGMDSIEGSASKDYLFGGDDRDFIDGEQGNDVIWGGAGHDRLEGDEGNDIVFGEDGDDTITGGTGNDRLYGNADIDHIRGEDGDDLLFGGKHEDVLEGGIGDNDVRVYGEYEKIEQLMRAQLVKARAYV